MRLKDYIEDNGMKMNWFAEKIGMRADAFRHAMMGARGIPTKYWKKIIKLTNGKVNWEDLYDHYTKKNKS